MKQKLKIAIYSGVIPSTTFIENLIQELSLHHNVLLFGTVKSTFGYKNKNICIIETPTNQWKNLLLTSVRLCKLIFTKPKFIGIAFKEANRYSRPYERWMRFCRFIPVLLYQPDIFHLQWASKIDRWIFLKSAYDVKIVLSLLGTHINISPLFKAHLKASYSKHFPNVDAFHAVCDSLGKEAERYGASSNNIFKIYTPVLSSTISQFELQKRTIKEPIALVSVGRHHWVKGYTYAIDAIKILTNKGLDIHYTIVAKDKPPESLLFQVQQLGLNQYINFKTTLAQEDLFKFLKTQDLMLLPSLSEGIANVVVEAMALGLPVISSNCGGMGEVVVSNETGWLVPLRDPMALAREIFNYSNLDQNTKEHIIVNAHQLIEKNFNSQLISTKMEALYYSLVNNNNVSL